MSTKRRNQSKTELTLSKMLIVVKRLNSAFEAVTWLVLGAIFGAFLHHAFSGSAIADESSKTHENQRK